MAIDPTSGSARDARDTVLYLYRFGVAELDESRLELRVGGLSVDLEQRPLEVLRQLLRHPDELVTREELFDAVWGNRPTVDNVLANAVAKLRKALGPEVSPRLITLPRQGYRLAGPVERVAAGRRHMSRFDFVAGMPVPGRSNFHLESLLGPSRQNEVWRARHEKTGELRVYKFSVDGDRLASLKREATICRVLREGLGERDDYVRIIDWNFETAPFYLECEYGGTSLSEWAAGEPGLVGLTEDERVDLFLAMADAVAAAHSVGVLHKDLKPANVLIANSAGSRKVRIADFGSGRLLEPGRLEDLGITALGLTVTQAMGLDTSGTALYLAPELLTGQAPTTRSDVYALGLMLYQLLVGDLRRPLAPGWERHIGDELLREDIAAATSGDPTHRLGSVGELCDRLRGRSARRGERALLREAEARAQLAARRLEHSRARRPWAWTAGIALCVALAMSLWGMQRTRVARDEARRQAEIAGAVNQFMIDEFIRTADPNVSGRKDVTMIEAVRAAVPAIDRHFASRSPAIQAALHLAMQKALSLLSDPQGAVAEAGKAQAAYRQAQPLDVAGLSESRLWMAHDLSRMGDYPGASGLLDAVERDLKTLKQPRAEILVRLPQVRALVAADQMDIKGGYEWGLRAWRLAEAHPELPAALRDTLEFSVADSQIMLGLLPQAEDTLRKLVARQSERLGPNNVQVANTRVLLANCLVIARRLDEAEAVIVPAIDVVRDAWGDKARRTLLAESVLANLRLIQGRYAEAAERYASLYARNVELYGPTNQASLAFLGGQAISTQFAGDLIRAESLLRLGLQHARQLFGEANPQIQHLRYRLAVSLLDQHRAPAEPGQLLEGLDAAILNVAEQQDDWAGRLDYQRARLLIGAGRRGEAHVLLERALGAARARTWPDPDLPVQKLQSELAQLDARSSLAGDAS